MPLYLKDKLVSGTGAQGKSAYQTAAEAGYMGNEAAFNEALSNVPGHIANKDNPHGVTAAQVNAYTKGETDTLLQEKADSMVLQSHIDNTNNPHGVTAAQVGAVASTEKGAASGVATLGTDGKVPAEQLPTMNYAPAYTYGTEDLTAGTSALETGKMYIVYEP